MKFKMNIGVKALLCIVQAIKLFMKKISNND